MASGAGRMKVWIRTLGLYARALAATAIVLMLGLAVLHAALDRPDPEVEALLAPRTETPVAEDRNAYFQFIGLGAPPGESAHAWGAHWFATALENDRALAARAPDTAWPEALDPAPDAGRVPSEIEPRGLRELCSEDPGCLIQAVGRRQGLIVGALEERGETLRRWDEMHRFPAFYQPPRPDGGYQSRIEPFGPLARAATLAELRVLSQIARGDVERAVAQLETEIAFARRAVAGSRSLISLMAARNLLERWYRVAAELASTRPQLLRPHARRLAATLAPLAEGDLDLRHIYGEEFRVSARLLRHDVFRDGVEGTGAGWLARGLSHVAYAPESTLSAIYDISMRDPLRWGERTTREYWEEVERNGRCNPAAGNMTDLLPYNGVGRLIAYIGAASFQDYLRRVKDLETLRVLVAAQVEAISSGATTPEAVARAILAAEGVVRNARGWPPEWNADKGEVTIPKVTAMDCMTNDLPAITIRLGAGVVEERPTGNRRGHR